MRKKQQGFYQIFGSDGHVYDSLFLAFDDREAKQIVETAAKAIKRSSGLKSLTGKAQYLLGEKNRDAGNWVSVDVSKIRPEVNTKLNVY